MAERTRQWIAAAMKELMKTTPVDKIRITELCRKAQIERPAFYYYFKDKYDVIAWIFYQEAGKTEVCDREGAANALRGMKRDMSFYRRAYEDVSQNALWRYMLEYFSERYIKEAMRILNVDSLDAQTLFSIRLYCFGCVGMTQEWALYDDLTSAETEVDMMYASMPAELHRIYFGD
ncbi:MAG: TetR/AcrR family transcriptional regulator C-terminal domain-containing protein [Solobacterium sp.]|nr:TetR/AcrR family transcriptional regulator C-terminal domain-containing protein [Solobacterium sp.]